MPSNPDDEPTEQADDQPEEPSDEQPAEKTDEQPTDEQPADDQPTDKTDEQSADEQSADDQPTDKTDEQPTDEQPADDQPTDKTDEQPAGNTDEQASEQPVNGADDGKSEDGQGQSADQAGLNAKRQAMLDLINKWMPTSLSNPRVEGKSVKPGQDLMAKAGWDKTRGQQSVDDRAAGKAVTTSCGDILAALLRLWKSNFVGYFGIRDAAVGGPGAKARGFYVEREQLVIEDDVVKSPQPGDIIVLRNGIGKTATGVGHVGILVEAGKDVWKTADGGGGQLPDQTAGVTERTVRWVDGVPIMKSVTDAKEKELDGWIDLDRLEQTG